MSTFYLIINWFYFILNANDILLVILKATLHIEYNTTKLFTTQII